MGTLKQRHVFLTGALLFSFVALIAGCGGGSSGSKTATPSSSASPVASGSSTASTSSASSPAGSSTSTTAKGSIPVGSSTHAISVGGTKRSYLVYRPAHLPAAAPLVVMLHGGFGTAANAEKTYGWDAEADSGGFIVAYPDGLNHAWNTGGGCCGQSARTNVDDVGFITQMVAEIESDAPIDHSRVYAAGISNGGIMTYTLACKTTIFAAIGPDSATSSAIARHRSPSPSSTSTARPTRRSPTPVAKATAAPISTAPPYPPSTPPGAASTTARSQPSRSRSP